MKDKSSPRVCLFGAAPDTGNQGVTALFQSVLTSLKRNDIDQICVFDHGQGSRAGQMSVNGEKITYSRIGAVNGRRYHRPDNLTHMLVASRLGGLGNAGVRAVQDADVVLDVSGGDSFTELYGPKRFRTVVYPKLIALRTRRPLLLLPQTYGPFFTKRGRKVARQILQSSGMAWARDTQSFAHMRDLLGSAFDPAKHKQGVDMAFALQAVEPEFAPYRRAMRWLTEPTADLRVVGFNVSGLIYNQNISAQRRFGLKADYRRVVHQFLDGLLSKTNVRVVLIPHVQTSLSNPESDLAASYKVISVFAHKYRDRIAVLDGKHSASELKWAISRCSWFCGTRMHSTIAALSSGVPTAALAYSLKTEGVFATCLQGAQVFDLRTLDVSQTQDKLFASWKHRRYQQQCLSQVMPLIKDRAMRQMDEIAEFIWTAQSRRLGDAT